jgi:hypothetical protein
MRAVIGAVPISGGKSRKVELWMRLLRAAKKLAGPDELHPIAALVRMGNPIRTAGKEGQAFSVIRHLRRHYQKSPFRRCFKPRPPLRAGCAGFASGCRSHG